MSLLERRGASAVSGKGGEDVPGKLVGQGKRWTRHPPAPGSPRTARDCASKLERDAGTVTARYARHISSLLPKPYVIVRPSYVQLRDALSPAGTGTGGSSHCQGFVTFPGRHTDTSPVVRQLSSPLACVCRRSPRTSTSRRNSKHLGTRTEVVVAPAGAWSVPCCIIVWGNARIIVEVKKP